MTKHTPSVPALSFHDQKFTITRRDGQPWLRVSQIGRALGYAKPDAHMTRLYLKHAAEFTDSMTALVKLKTKGGEQEVRIFSLRGAHLLGMFARTERAAEFRRWVLDILDADTGAEAQRRAKPGANQLTVQPVPQARAGINLRTVMMDGNSAPTVPLTPDLQAAINRKAWAMAHDAFELCREHLARRVAYRCEFGHPERLLNEERARAIVSETTLDMALTPRYHNQLAALLDLTQMVADHARDNLTKMREELKGMTK